MAERTRPAETVKTAKRALTTTSYAILGLLAVRSWSGYELTQQMERSLRFHWPRAQTRVYMEAPNLVAHALASSRQEHHGRRARTVYTITQQGRRALSNWLTEPCSPPRLEAEALLRSMFADTGTKSDLERTLEQLADHAKEAHGQLLRQGADYLATGGPYPERLHLIALNGRFLLAFTQLLHDWASQARTEITTWPDTGPLPSRTDPIAVFRRVLGASLVHQIEQATQSRNDEGQSASTP